MPIVETLNPSDFEKSLIFKEKDVFLNPDGSLPDGKTAARLINNISQDKIEYGIGEMPESVFAAVLAADSDEVQGLRKFSVRECFASGDEKKGEIIARARTLLKWSEEMKFCPKCGSLLTLSGTHSSKTCPKCGKEHFPRIEPCIIVLVKKDDELLLARHVSHASDVFTCIAGFIEAGESAECAVAREVKEETGISVKNVRYFASQSWPYPDQLMLGFYADYDSGEISVQKEELHEAAWFCKKSLPKIPKRGSMAYRLITECCSFAL